MVHGDSQNIFHPVMNHLSIKDLNLEPDITPEKTEDI